MIGHRPQRRTGPREHDRRPLVLVSLRGRGGVPAAAHGLPCAVVELVLAAELTAAAHRARVATRLAGRDGLELRRGGAAARCRGAGARSALRALALDRLGALVLRALKCGRELLLRLLAELDALDTPVRGRVGVHTVRVCLICRCKRDCGYCGRDGAQHTSENLPQRKASSFGIAFALHPSPRGPTRAKSGTSRRLRGALVREWSNLGPHSGDAREVRHSARAPAQRHCCSPHAGGHVLSGAILAANAGHADTRPPPPLTPPRALPPTL